jgi:hypothetical protein
MKKQGNEVALRQSASLAALAWSRLEQAAQETLNAGNEEAPAVCMVANTSGITLHATDKFGTSVTVQGGTISCQVASQEPD